MPEKKEDKWKLYFIAIIPGAPFFEEALKMKHYFSDHHNSKAALKSPPHVTLHMPFKWKEKKEKELVTKLTSFSETHPPITLQFNNFGCFTPRVIFIDIKKSAQLETLQHSLQRFCKQALNLFNANYKELPFHPHLTVAFRDLKKASFEKAWEEFATKKFEGELTVKNIVLLKHNGKVWEVLQPLPLTGQSG